MASLYQNFCSRWKDGCGAEICASAKRQCFARGSLPADILLIGEAPGETEDMFGQPFVGPAGLLLDKIVREAVPKSLRCCFTNLVLCIPREENGDKSGEPDGKAIKACAPRLVEFYRIAAPSLVVCVGALSQKWTPKILSDAGITPNRLVSIKHPAAILRAPLAGQGLDIRRCVVTIQQSLE